MRRDISCPNARPNTDEMDWGEQGREAARGKGEESEFPREKKRLTSSPRLPIVAARSRLPGEANWAEHARNALAGKTLGTDWSGLSLLPARTILATVALWSWDALRADHARVTLAPAGALGAREANAVLQRRGWEGGM